ncbi:MAG: hypothetical protein ABI281_07620 [Caldimonas sp.]
MNENPEQAYTDLLSQLASPSGTTPELLAGKLRDVERMHSMGQLTDWQLQNAQEAYARAPASKLAGAAEWVLDKTKEGLHAGVDRVSDYTRVAVNTYTLREPVRAIVIAAVTGALLMGLVSRLVRSGARRVERRLRR